MLSLGEELVGEVGLVDGGIAGGVGCGAVDREFVRLK